MQDEQKKQATLRVRTRLLQHHLERTGVWLRWEDLQRRMRIAEG